MEVGEGTLESITRRSVAYIGDMSSGRYVSRHLEVKPGERLVEHSNQERKQKTTGVHCYCY